jgi:hypothetical protein
VKGSSGDLNRNRNLNPNRGAVILSPKTTGDNMVL